MVNRMKLPRIKDILHDRFLAATVEHLDPVSAVSVGPQEPIKSVIDQMARDSIGCILIIDKQAELVGICTERDILKKVALREAEVYQAPVSSIMTHRPRAVKNNVSVARALFEMVSGGFRHLPVLDSKECQYRVISSKGFVDFVYRHLTKQIAANPVIEILKASAVDEFFLRQIHELSPDKPVLLHEDQPLNIVLKRLQQRNIGAILAINKQQKLSGIFSERDYLIKVAGEGLESNSLRLKEVMTARPKTVLESATISLAFNLLSEGGFRHLPVVDELEELKGVVTIRNFMSYLSHEIMAELK